MARHLSARGIIKKKPPSINVSCLYYTILRQISSDLDGLSDLVISQTQWSETEGNSVNTSPDWSWGPSNPQLWSLWVLGQRN